MDKKTAQDLIETTFNSAFSEEQFTIFAKNLLNDMESRDNRYNGNLIWDDFKEHINSYKRIGKYTDPNGEALDVLIAEVKSVTKLERARTALRNFVIKHLSKFDKDYALVAFYSKEDGGADWRFSFIKLEYRSELDEEKGKVKIRKEFTPAKRYSFLVGEYEKAHTAKNQLLPLLQNISGNPTIEQIEAAFSIDKVTDEFFIQYKDLYIKLYEHFENDHRVKTAFEKAGIDNSRFTKKLLGQIVFLYFLQKKGWLGVAQNARWGTGKKRFVQDLFEQAQTEGVNFFSNKLQYLFYEALAKERDNVNSYYKRFDCRIPFLNGGLFEADYNWQEAGITIPETLFRNDEKNKAADVGTGILDVFDRYNFTIKEDEPLDKEVAVDPEMLGKVFENMLDITERKSKGAFYTPREIVHYMCQESLIHYLDNALEEKVKKNDIETFIREGHFALENDERVAAKGETKTYQYQLPESIRKNADLIDKQLSDIKICDPAIGSGAFPVGLLHELVNAMLVLKPHLSYNYLTKKLKGFGFEENGRTLSVAEVSDSRYIYRLKRHIIQESIYGVDIDSSAIDIARLRLWLSLVVDEDDLDPIETLPNLDYKIVCGNSLIGLPDTAMRSLPVEKELETLKTQFYNLTDEKEKQTLRTQINTKIRELLDSAETFAGYKIDFDFKLFFSEVWREKGGFDVVIGNPPFVSHDKISNIEKNIFKNRFKSYSSFADLYCFFIETAIKLENDKGIITIITSNSYLRAEYGKPLRDFIISKNKINSIINIEDYQLFSSAIVNSSIIIADNTKIDKRAKIINDVFDNKVSLEKFIENKAFYYYQIDFQRKNWNLIKPEQLIVLKKIEKDYPTLEKLNTKIRLGLATGDNNAFIINEQFANALIKKNKKNSEIIKPILRGRDIDRYGYSFSNLYILLTKNEIDVKNNYSDVYEYFDSLGDKFKSRGAKGRHWTNLRACSFFDDFSEEKIIWIELADKGRFAYSNSEIYLLNSAYFLIPPKGLKAKFLLAILNSSIIYFYLLNNAETSGMGTSRWINNHVKEFPIKISTDAIQNQLSILTDYLIYLASLRNDSIYFSFFDSLIDSIIYELYFPEEIKSAGKEILKHLGDLKPITDEMSEEEKLAVIQSEYERLSHAEHPVKRPMDTLEEVEEVRIIREALK